MITTWTHKRNQWSNRRMSLNDNKLIFFHAVYMHPWSFFFWSDKKLYFLPDYKIHLNLYYYRLKMLCELSSVGLPTLTGGDLLNDLMNWGLFKIEFLPQTLAVCENEAGVFEEKEAFVWNSCVKLNDFSLGITRRDFFNWA